jgi:hypothetical protein
LRWWALPVRSPTAAFGRPEPLASVAPRTFLSVAFGHRRIAIDHQLLHTTTSLIILHLPSTFSIYSTTLLSLSFYLFPTLPHYTYLLPLTIPFYSLIYMHLFYPMCPILPRSEGVYAHIVPRSSFTCYPRETLRMYSSHAVTSNPMRGFLLLGGRFKLALRFLTRVGTIIVVPGRHSKHHRERPRYPVDRL